MARAAALVTGLSGASVPVASTAAPAADALPVRGSLLALPALELFGGRRFEPSQAGGRLIVVYWWASWCPFCALQSPHMERLWRDAQPRGLQMLALSIDQRPEDAMAYLARHGYTFPSGLYTPAVARALAKPKGLPVTVVRGRDGRVLMAEAGQLFPEDIEQIAQWL
jgi:hypothetical protein